MDAAVPTEAVLLDFFVAGIHHSQTLCYFRDWLQNFNKSSERKPTTHKHTICQQRLCAS